MLNEEEKFSINLEKLFPEAARRVEILEALKNSWPAVVGVALASHSMPYNLGVNEISIAVDSQNAEIMLKNMKGNILRALKLRFNFISDGEFNLKITKGVPNKRLLKIKNVKKIHASDIKISEEEVNKLMAGAPETLPEDINYSISHLKVFLEKFKRKN